MADEQHREKTREEREREEDGREERRPDPKRKERGREEKERGPDQRDPASDSASPGLGLAIDRRGGDSGGRAAHESGARSTVQRSRHRDRESVVSM
jgi:hypothetical protein